MSGDWKVTGQYYAAARSISELIDDNAHDDIPPADLAVSAQICIALSNLAVAEAVHRVADRLAGR